MFCPSESFRKYWATVVLIKMNRALTKKTDNMMNGMELPTSIKLTIINCADPAYVISDIKNISKTLKPLVFPTTPKARPIPMYPKTVGIASLTPFQNLTVHSQHHPLLISFF